jgi:hypothetical protein
MFESPSILHSDSSEGEKGVGLARLAPSWPLSDSSGTFAPPKHYLAVYSDTLPTLEAPIIYP